MKSRIPQTNCSKEVYIKIKYKNMIQIRKEATMNYKPQNHLWNLSPQMGGTNNVSGVC